MPDIRIDGYNWQRLDLNAADFGSRQRRLRHIQFGSCDDTQLMIERPSSSAAGTATVTANDSRSIDEIAALQGLPAGFDIPSFTHFALSSAIGNGVPYPMAYALALAVKNRRDWGRLCACSCGRPVVGRQLTATGACRKRLFDRKLLLTR